MIDPKTGDDVPAAVGESIITLLGVTLRVYVLDNGQTVMHADDLKKLLIATDEHFASKKP
jgi:hypothetical protein